MTEQTPEPTTRDLMAELQRVAAAITRPAPEPIILTQDELIELTGYKMAARQLVELHLAGFHRARIGPAGRIILERAHYQAVCAGQIQREKPKLRPYNPSR